MSNRTRTPWPRRLAKDTALTAHLVDVDGVERWHRLRRDGHGYRWQVASTAPDGWTIQDIGDPCMTVGDAVGSIRGLMLLGKGTLLEITTQDEHEHTVLHGLVPSRLVAEDGEGWSAGIAEQWSGLDDDLPLDIPHTTVWATINAARVILITPTDGTGMYPALFDLDENTFRGLHVVAETSWFSESGGAPVTWNGGSRLADLYPGMLLRESWGDFRQELELVPAQGPTERAATVVALIFADDQQFAAACQLEQFDTDGLLTAPEAEEWAALLNAPDVTISLDLEPFEELPACRDALRRDDSYIAVADALARPTSVAGQSLKARLEGIRDSGVIGRVVGNGLGDA